MKREKRGAEEEHACTAEAAAAAAAAAQRLNESVLHAARQVSLLFSLLPFPSNLFLRTNPIAFSTHDLWKRVYSRCTLTLPPCLPSCLHLPPTERLITPSTAIPDPRPIALHTLIACCRAPAGSYHSLLC